MKSDFKEMYERLNTEQKQAVDTIEGPVFVMAGPGTGKTQILTLRIANILRQTDVDPENVLALTFTNAAAYNMRERLGNIVGAELAHRVCISTFHSFAEDMMKTHADAFPDMSGARLISPIEQIQLIEEILDEMKTEAFSVFKRRENTLKSIVFSLGQIKGEGLTPDEFREKVKARFEKDKDAPHMFYKRKYGDFAAGDRKPHEMVKLQKTRDKNMELADIYESYEKKLRDTGRYDFSDIIVQVVHGLKEPDSLFRAELQEQFQYILVDEHQDTNDAQNDIVHALIDNPVWEGKPNLFVVGDSKQAIFRFAGASKASYERLRKSLKDPVIINLQQNYRSQQRVLDHAYTLIKQSGDHADETNLQAFFDHGGVVEYREFNDYKMEMLWLVQDIKSRIENGEDPDEIVVLYRDNKNGDDVRHLCDVLNVPYKDFSKKNLLTDPTVLKLFWLLRSVHNPVENESVARALFIDFLEFDVFQVQRILNKSRNARGAYHSSLVTILEDPKKLAEIGIEKEDQKKYAKFVQFLRDQKSKSKNADFFSFFSDFVRESGYLEYLLSQPDSVRSLGKLEKIFDEIKKESIARASFGFDEFIHYLDTLKKYNLTMNVTNTLAKGISLMTFHGSKGLEFETVYMIKALQKRKTASEISLPFDDFSDGSTDDERRLFYVALTRAKKNCFISSFIYNEEGREKTRSLHIDEMDAISHVDMGEWEKEHASDIHMLFGESNEHIQSLVDTDYIKERFLANKLSVSALNNFVESPLKYYFRNLIFLPEAKSPFLDFGNLIHETLEEFFVRSKNAGEILPDSVLQESFDAVLDKRPVYREYKDRGWDVLKNYFDYYREDFDIPIENEFRVPPIPFELNNGETIMLTGVIDKITRKDNGEIVVWDYKTGRAFSDMDKDRREKIKRQAAFYKFLLQNAFSGKYNFHTAVFDFLQPNKSGEYEHASFEVTQDDVDEVKEIINQLATAIFDGSLLSGDFYRDSGNKELLEFLEVLRGPRTREQLNLF
jgi:DNA helicase-2/ATP-dependent DNA helicase PcrA